MVTIVTPKSYIQTNKIHYISMDEHFEDVYLKGTRHSSVPMYIIHVVFEPTNANTNQSTRNDQMNVEIRVYGLKRATALFKNMVDQIREQCPDQLYLDKIAEQFLTGVDLDDPSPDKICIIGKEKRRSKKVLRRAKRSNKRSSKRSRR